MSCHPPTELVKHQCKIKEVVGCDDSIHVRAWRSRQQLTVGMETKPLLFPPPPFPPNTFFLVHLWWLEKKKQPLFFIFLHDINVLLVKAKWEGKLYQAYLNLQGVLPEKNAESDLATSWSSSPQSWLRFLVSWGPLKVASFDSHP